MNLMLKMIILAFAMLCGSCRHGSAGDEKFDEVSLGWRNYEGNPNVVWINDEPIIRFVDGGMLQNLSSFPLRNGNNSLRAIVEGSPTMETDWSKFTVRFISQGLTRN